MTIQYEIGHNRILDTLSDAALQRLSPHLTKVSLSSGTIVHDVGDLPS